MQHRRKIPRHPAERTPQPNQHLQLAPVPGMHHPLRPHRQHRRRHRHPASIHRCGTSSPFTRGAVFGISIYTGIPGLRSTEIPRQQRFHPRSRLRNECHPERRRTSRFLSRLRLWPSHRCDVFASRPSHNVRVPIAPIDVPIHRPHRCSLPPSPWFFPSPAPSKSRPSPRPFSPRKRSSSPMAALTPSPWTPLPKPPQVAEPYNSLYLALQNWGHWQLLSSPDDADLILVVRFTAPLVTGPAYAPQLELTILDGKTHCPSGPSPSPSKAPSAKPPGRKTTARASRH